MSRRGRAALAARMAEPWRARWIGPAASCLVDCSPDPPGAANADLIYVAWRGWKVQGGLLLGATRSHVVWPPGRAIQGPRSHPRVYGAVKRSTAEGYGASQGGGVGVVGLVALWGNPKVSPGEIAARFGYPLTLDRCVGPYRTQLAPLRARYGLAAAS